ncbi:MAG: GDYXXLXY domain-containing protein [Verrucomicrobiae bacterium]|nr:GDYXXLXY domain-containing protein [Verrucomicrobiae bacterium]
MNKTKIILISFVVIGMIQLSIVIYQIARYEYILKTGEIYKIRTAPVDPHDIFRGKYVALRYSNTHAPVKKGDKIKSPSRAYVSLSKDKNGFAIFTELSSTPPKNKDYLRVKTYSEHNFTLPYNRFYMEESIASQAEELYRTYTPRFNQADTNNYALLRVKDGRGVIEDLYVNGVQIRKLIESK